MSNQSQTGSALRSQIIENPDVILRDSELMSALLRADGGTAGRNVVDLRGKLVERLEDQLDQLEETNRHVIAAAYENLAGTNQVHRAVLQLLSARTFTEFLTVLGGDVQATLGVDTIRLGLETVSARPGSPMGPKGPMADVVIAMPRNGVAAYLCEAPEHPGRKVTLRRATELAEDMFGAGDAWIQSEAVLRLDLGEGTHPALMAMGSEDPQRFTPDHASDLLAFFASAFELMLRRWLA